MQKLIKIARREFLLLAAGIVAGCKDLDPGSSPATNKSRLVNAGPAAGYSADGVYDAFRAQGFFIVRQGERLFALSAICTHRNCKLTVQPDRSFYCKCHGSTFARDGHVTKGPAKRDLPILPVTNEAGQLVIELSST